MELTNGYYEDAEKRIYKVTDEQVFIYEKAKFVPLLGHQEFVMQLLNNLLVKKNIVELVDSSISFLVYPDGDCPDEVNPCASVIDEQNMNHVVDSLRYAFSNYETVVSSDVFCNFDLRIELPLTPDQEIDLLESDMESLYVDRRHLVEQLDEIDSHIFDLDIKIAKLQKDIG